jgi:hypothetical protein
MHGEKVKPIESSEGRTAWTSNKKHVDVIYKVRMQPNIAT